jgi:hypothetical protein
MYSGRVVASVNSASSARPRLSSMEFIDGLNRLVFPQIDALNFDSEAAVNMVCGEPHRI